MIFTGSLIFLLRHGNRLPAIESDGDIA